MQEPKILFFLSVWKRPEITELCFMGLQRLMKHSSVKALAVISEREMIPLCHKYGIEFIYHDNEPLGAKKNAGLDYAMRLEWQWDYLIELGSDDLITEEIFEAYAPLMAAGEEFFGSDSMYFIDATDGHCRLYRAQEAQYGRGWGLGRALSRKAIEKFGKRKRVRAFTPIMRADGVIGENEIGFVPFNVAQQLAEQGIVEVLDSGTYSLWTDSAMRMLDNDSSIRLEAHGFKYKAVETPEPFLADIKSDENIWAFNPELGDKVDVEQFISRLSKEEKAKFFANMKKLKARRIETA